MSDLTLQDIENLARVVPALKAENAALRERMDRLERQSITGEQSEGVVALQRFKAADGTCGFSVNETAEITGYSKSTLNLNRTKGWPGGKDLKFIKRGAKITYLKRDIVSFMQDRRVNNLAEAGALDTAHG